MQQMQPLLDDLALLHGQVTGTLTLNLVQVDLSDWLTTNLLPWRAMALEKGLQWSSEIPESLPVVHIDPERMAQVLGNLLSNAVKYTPERGNVVITAGSGAAETWFQIRDTGPGIDLVEQEQVFEPFFRSSRETRFPQGMGLGLSIAREIVNAHGGQITVQSQHGEGSLFKILLPASSG